MAKTLTALVILDGFGLRDDPCMNAVRQAKTPNLDRYFAKYPHTQVEASGMAVGLPEGQMGNSEVGHLNIGAGRVVYQELTRVTKSIMEGDFFTNKAFLNAMQKAKSAGCALHVFGLLSDGGVHSHIDHIFALIEMAKKQNLSKVFLHCFMDGRDTPPQSGKGYIEQTEKKLAEIGCGQIATIIGRYYAMDRDNRWERVEVAYKFIKPIVITKDGKPLAQVSVGDSVIFMNFRQDRAREITRAFIFEDFDKFVRKNGYFKVNYVSLTQYDETFGGKVEVAYEPEFLTNTLGEYLSSLCKTQLRIAETEKYAHVTFFFNGGVEKENPGEDRVLIPSPKVATYDLKPEMSAFEVAQQAKDRILSGNYDLMVLNFANPDMVGHTGIMKATVDAIEVVDACVGKVVDAILDVGGTCLLTADHGNAECMAEPDGTPMTAHTTNPVPILFISDAIQGKTLRSGGALCDLAPTLLEIMGIPQPKEMTGKTLLV
jgi:2,3-bisphosphoglycerate-independent phosphoglycerate mutase